MNYGVGTPSVTLEEIEGIGIQMSSGDGPFPRSDVEEKEREVIHSNRVKLTDYIHDPTVLFPYMKESDVFSVFDCEIIKGNLVLTASQTFDWTRNYELHCSSFVIHSVC